MYKILLIDDDADVRELLSNYIKQLHSSAEVFLVGDGKSGLKILANNDIDCVLVDYELPDINGFAFMQFIQENTKIPNLPIIMISGLGNETIAAESIKRGASDYLVKTDLTQSSLGLAVKNAVDLFKAEENTSNTDTNLISSTGLYKELFEDSNDLILKISPKGKLMYANAAMCNALGYSIEEVKESELLKLLHPKHIERCKLSLKKVASGESVLDQEYIFLTKDKKHLLVEGNFSCQYENKKLVALRSIFRDITDRRIAELALKREKERLQLTLRSISDAVITTNAEGLINFMNPAAESLTGWLLKDGFMKTVDHVYKIESEETNEALPNPVLECLENNVVVLSSDSTVLISKDGHRYAIQDSSSPIINQSNKVLGAILVFQDVTSAREVAEKIKHQSRHDHLTGLLNRREFEQHLHAALESAKNDNFDHVLCFLDLDNFKIVNDTAGHIAGDALLKQTSGLLKSSIRSNDTLARVGGDEFCILLESCPLEKAQDIANDIIKSVREQRFSWDEKFYEIGVSIGIVPINRDSESTSQILSHADVACYTAKNRGRNQAATYYADDNDATTVKSYGDLVVASNLHDALKNDNFCLHAQAIKNLKTDSISYELLIRMIDEKGEIVYPGAFIPAAERFNIIKSIDRWVIKNAFQQYHSVFGDTENTRIAINLSGSSLTDNDLLDYILAEFEISGVKPECVCFEITETAAISHMGEAMRLITALKKHGCSISLDDFGSGMSSFNYLKQFPIDYLKIDGGFVKDMLTNPIDLAMVESINRIGQVMGIETIAEWVENDEILSKLKIMGLDYVQGYAIGHPEPLENLSLTNK